MFECIIVDDSDDDDDDDGYDKNDDENYEAMTMTASASRMVDHE